MKQFFKNNEAESSENKFEFLKLSKKKCFKFLKNIYQKNLLNFLRILS